MYCQFVGGLEKVVSFSGSYFSQGQVQVILVIGGKKHCQGIALQLGCHFCLPLSSTIVVQCHVYLPSEVLVHCSVFSALHSFDGSNEACVASFGCSTATGKYMYRY